jgi:MFS transporter, DHA1 family, multidrug resistance protein
MGALQMGIGALASAITGYLMNNSAIPMTAVMACCATIGLIIVTLGRKRLRMKARSGDVEEQAFDQLEKY